MPLFDLDGTTYGSGSVHGTAVVLFGLSGATAGGGELTSDVALDHVLSDSHVSGAANVSGTAQTVWNVSGHTRGASSVYSTPRWLAEGVADGAGIVTGAVVRVVSLRGYALGASTVSISLPQPIQGVAVVTGFMEVRRAPLPICQTPQVDKRFRWGQPFGFDDLGLCVTGSGGSAADPVCITYTLYQIQRGCTPKQVGRPGRKPGKRGLGCYYATGFAGECGQPGLWMIRWSYQTSFGAAPITRDCYFYVLDSVLNPVPGDMLPRFCKYGWD